MEAFALNQIRFLLILVPPGTTKSSIVSVCYPAWRWIKTPSLRFLVGANESDLAERDSMACRRVVLSEWYTQAYRTDRNRQSIWQLRADKNESNWYETTAGGHRQAVTVGKSVVGKKGDENIMDDPNDAKKIHSKAECRRVKQWYGEAFFNRVNDFKTAKHCMIGQHTGTDDLQSTVEKDPDWVVLSLPEEFDSARRCVTFLPARPDKPFFVDPRKKDGDWLRPTRFGPEEKRIFGKRYGPRAYAAQHQQKPEKLEGRMFDRANVNRVGAIPVGTRIARYWDTAASEDDSACYSSGVLLGKTPSGRTIILHERRGRWNPAQRNREIREMAFRDQKISGCTGYRLYWEKGAADSGKERDQELAKYLHGLPAFADPARGDKIERATPFSAQWEAGNVDLYDDGGDWIEEYLEAMEGFPAADNKDTTDASSGCYNKLSATSSAEPAAAPPEQTVVGQLPKGTFRTRSYG